MAYVILRTQKLNHLASVRRSLKHGFRAQETPNAIAELEDQNTYFGALDVQDAMTKVKALLPAKRRKDAVLVIEYLITASPTELKSRSRAAQDAYFETAMDWLRSKHGSKYVVCGGIHRDELSPHMYVYVVPIDTAGRLNCRSFLGGSNALREMQTDFAVQVGTAHGFERGIESSRATHQTIRSFYAQLDKPAPPIKISADDVQPKVLSKTFLKTASETPEMIADRLTESVRRRNAATAAAAALSASERRRAEEMRRTAKAKNDELQVAQAAIKNFSVAFVDGLTEDQIQDLVSRAESARQETKFETEKQRRVDRLSALLSHAAEAVRVFASHAVEAIKKALGNWREVVWLEVENKAIGEAVHDRGCSYSAAVRAVYDHSPGRADNDDQSRAADIRKAEELDKLRGQLPK